MRISKNLLEMKLMHWPSVGVFGIYAITTQKVQNDGAVIEAFLTLRKICRNIGFLWPLFPV